jgi:hypothetical protein
MRFNALLENGDIYHWSDGAWFLAGNLFGFVTQDRQETWGALKARYRNEDTAAQDR